jgi:hypothetical protein
MKVNKRALINLPATEDELEAEIKRQDEPGFTIQNDEDALRFLMTRIATADLEIDRSLEKGDITPEEAETLRERYVKGPIRDLYDEPAED